MKKMLSLMTGIALVLSPTTVYAKEKHRNGHGCGWLCGALIGGVLVGVLTSKDREDRRREEEGPRSYNSPGNYYYYDPGNGDLSRHQVCFEEQIVEYRNGYKIIRYEYRCR